MNKFRYGYVVTGGIGSGKSTFCNLLKIYGYSVIDADKIAHEILNASADEVARLFGDRFIKTESSIKTVDRKALGTAVFSDKSKLEKLENLLHPKIKDEIYKYSNELERLRVAYFADIPLFFERGNYDKFNKVVLVYAPLKLLLKRVMARDNLDENATTQRLNTQMDIEKKLELADIVIDNSRDLAHLTSQTEKFINMIKG
ncbi:dephospho-CoA kinase [Campylobacter sp. faydin G-140]|uniref:dephospho-CoA kinase n=1 Tax=Campylobacter anatolicus TaxID=2829105 RepID=UPI001B9C7291|nr:dephospho-CoA kinase [Campylobacter anatolicus]MBR8466136.1 dephospho-CoA kinase [Campylobacter anatolicus]